VKQLQAQRKQKYQCIASSIKELEKYSQKKEKEKQKKVELNRKWL
jgi:hypothetical protein